MNSKSWANLLRHWPGRYGLALVAVGLSALLRWGLPDVLSRAPYLGFYPAVVVAAALGGVGPGLVATFGSLLLVNLVFVQFDLVDYGLQMRNLVWIVGSTGVSLLAGGLLAARRRAERFNAELEERIAGQTTEIRAANASLEQRVAERTQALHQSEEEFRALADAIPQLAWIARADGFIHWYNCRWYEYTGTTPEQMEGWGWQSVHDPQVLPQVLEQWKRSIATGKPFDMVFPLRGADGRFRPFLTRVQPLKDAHGAVLQWFGTNTDVEELKRAEEALRQSEERLRLATEAAKIGAFDWNIQTGVNIWTPELEAMYGLAPGEFRKSQPAWEQLVHPDDRAGAVAKVEETLATGSPVEHEWRVVWRDGSVHWIAGRFQGFKDAAGKPVRLAGANIDITARKQADATLRQSHERLKKVLEVEAVGVMFWDLNTGYLVDANDTFLKMMDYSRSDVESRTLTWQKFTPPEYHEVSLAEIRKFQATGRVGPYEKEYFRKDGTRRWLLFSGSSLGNNSCVEFCVDISARKNAEAALRESEGRYRALFENMRNGFAYCRMLFEDGKPQDFVYLAVNPAFEELTGLKDVVGKKVSEVIPGIRETDPKVIETYGRVALTGVPEQFEIFVKALGMWFAISVYSPAEEHFAAMFDVITARKQAEEELRRTNEELSRFNRVTVGRELRIIELKKQINEMCGSLGQPARFRPDYESDGKEVSG